MIEYGILGEQVDYCIRAFEPHRNHAWQRNRERAEIEILRASLTRV